MAAPNYKDMVALFSHPNVGVKKAGEWVKESFKAGVVKPEEVVIGRLFDECFGHGNYLACQNREDLCCNVMEAAGATSTAAFTNIAGNVVVSAIRKAYEDEEFVFSKIIEDEQSNQIGLERMADIVPIGDEALVVPEGKAFPVAGTSEDWCFLPEARKRGLEVRLTREVIFSMNANADFLKKCANVGQSLGISKEIRLIDCVIDENDGAVSGPLGHRYCRQGNYIQTYAANSGNHNFDNVEGSNTLLDWSDLDLADQLLNAMTHPGNGQPIILKGMYLVCAKGLEQVAKRIVNATEIKVATPGWATTGNPTETTMGNPYSGAFQVVTSRRVAGRLATDTTWFYGDLKTAFGYKTIFPFQTIMAPPLSSDEFHNDIVRQWRADEMGAAFTKEPRAMVTCTVA